MFVRPWHLLSRRVHSRSCEFSFSFFVFVVMPLLAVIVLGSARSASAQTSTPPTFVDSADPTIVAIRGLNMFWWRQAVRPGANPASTDLRVTLDARPLGGGYAAPFADEQGRCSDDAADNVFHELLRCAVERAARHAHIDAHRARCAGPRERQAGPAAGDRERRFVRQRPR